MKRQFVIGISAFYHESSIALFEKGRLICYLREEWLSRIKGDRLYPRLSLQHVKEKFAIKDEEVEAVCFYEKPLKGWLKLLHHGLRHPVKNRKMLANHLRSFWDGPVFVTSQIQNTFKIKREQIYFAPHHLSHALSALQFAPDNKGWAALVVDGVGDGECAVIYDVAEPSDVKKIWTADYPHSLGLFYSAVTDFLGFFVNEGEYQIMALASYGKPVYADQLMQDVVKVEDGDVWLNPDYFSFETDPERSFSDKMENLFGTCRDVRGGFPDLESDDFQKWADIAASAQSVFETCLEKLVRHACSITGRKKVLLSGGTALNCVAVSKLNELKDIEIFVPPSPGDAGASIGAGVFANTLLGHDVVQAEHVYLGSTGEEQLKNAPSDMGLLKLVADPENMIRVATDLITQGEIIATRIGEVEVGPRALGHRSLICDASNREVVEHLNIEVKKRAPFRPIAPLVHELFADNYFDLPKGDRSQFKWMGAVARAKPKTQEKYGGICHVDHSARLQIMDRECPQISDLLMACAERDIHVLTNTSFNIAGDPIVFDEIDAFASMKRMGLRYILQDKGLYEVGE